MLAQLGDYTFEASAQNVNTFTDLKFTNSAAYSEHKILGRKGLLEFTGLNASSCSLSIHLESSFTDKLEDTISYFYEAMNDGLALAFVIGGQVMGEGLWVIESLNESYPRISSRGEFFTADLSLNLKEYIDEEY